MKLVFTIFDYNGDGIIDTSDLFNLIKTSPENIYLNKYFIDVNVIFQFIQNKVRINEPSKISKLPKLLEYTSLNRTQILQAPKISQSLKNSRLLFQKDFNLINFPKEIPAILEELFFVISGIRLFDSEIKYLSSDSSCDFFDDQTKSSELQFNTKENIEFMNNEILEELHCKSSSLILKAFYSLCKNDSKPINHTYLSLNSMLKKFVY